MRSDRRIVDAPPRTRWRWYERNFYFGGAIVFAILLFMLYKAILP